MCEFHYYDCVLTRMGGKLQREDGFKATKTTSSVNKKKKHFDKSVTFLRIVICKRTRTDNNILSYHKHNMSFFYVLLLVFYTAFIERRFVVNANDRSIVSVLKCTYLLIPVCFLCFVVDNELH